ncbi:MAG: ABC transporter permease [Pseudopedobacter saltans]|uniref:ABC transporter permease n=1 Tax=Pseudopedobacter saltans TaxID=151895 RepID=A0A2W5H9E3_9SPHI|nr:MAG: ABC transporter permease [Pseudopedobacter saltans]
MGNFLQQIGGYVLMLRRMLYPPENWKMFFKRTLQSCFFVGVQSLGLVVVISFFLGMIAVLLCQYMVDNPVVPHFVIGVITRDLLLLELTPTGITALLACVVGFRTTFAMGSYRREEQIDALEVMGINTSSYLVFPFILSSVLMMPLLLVLSFFISLFGGFVLCYFANVIPFNDYVQGLQFDLKDISIEMFFTKIYFFSFIISSISAYLGYSFSGTVSQLSKRSTFSITVNCILLLLLDYAITDVFLYN